MKTFGKAERRLAMLHSLNVLIVILAQLVALSDGHPQLPRHTIRLYGNASLGYYYMNLLIGSPPQ